MSPNGTLSVNERKYFLRCQGASATKWGTQVRDECRSLGFSTQKLRTSFGRFIFMSETKTAQKKGRWREILLSPTLANKSAGKRVAYIAVTTALVVVCNMFFEFKLAETQFSFTIVVSSLAGILIGPIFGFVACFLGDLVGFLYHSAGFAYLPWIGISMGITALLSGFIVGGIDVKKGWFLYVKLALVSLLTFAICTVAINTMAFWILYSKVDYWTYFVSRIFVQGQIWNTLFNTALLFIVVPTLKSIKPLKIYIN